ncbi:unnamed protein product [Effrenium voratum]|uniref:Methyltransferase FkbM domain-containing protein n=1 Tax=Effrenium voratum TaxID=2562239 RepID=A0AA36NIW0_9DINO|nr:unnamed protein product [Effrenium voratum]CAJ1453929.1 unnamed protein product [Effrenium voratum]
MGGWRFVTATLFQVAASRDDACVQADLLWHGVRESLFTATRVRAPPYKKAWNHRLLTDLVRRVPSAGDGAWSRLSVTTCSLGEVALLLANFLQSGDRVLLEMALIALRKWPVSRIMASTWPIFGLLAHAQEVLRYAGDDSFAAVCADAAPLALALTRWAHEDEDETGVSHVPGNGTGLRELRLRLAAGGALASRCRSDVRATLSARMLGLHHDDYDSLLRQGSWPWLLFRTKWPLVPMLHRQQLDGREAACSQASPGSYGVLTRASPVSMWMCTTRTLEREHHRWITEGHFDDCTHIAQTAKAILRGACRFVDVGANMGCVSLFLAQLLPSLEVVSVEPNPRLARQLRGAVAKNQLTRVSVVEAALGAAQGSAVLSCPAENSGMCTVAVDHPSAAKQEVEQLSLDALVRERPPGSESNLPLCGVKIDVEGNEEEVLRGASAALAQKPPIFLDIHEEMLRRAGTSPAAVWDLISGYGYQQLADYSELHCLHVGLGRWEDFRWQGPDLEILSTVALPHDADACACHFSCAEQMPRGCRCWEFGPSKQCHLYRRCPRGWAEERCKPAGLEEAPGWWANDLFGRWLVT